MAGNKNSGRRKAQGPDVAPAIRGAFKRAVLALEQGGTPLSTIILKQLQEKPLETLKAISYFIPKELMIEATITEQLGELTDEAIADEIHRLTRKSAALAAAQRAADEERDGPVKALPPISEAG